MNAELEFAVRNDIEQLINQLASDNPTEREQARKSLVQIGHEAVIPLIHKLKSTSNRTCWEATKALGAIREMAAATDLAKNLNHDDGGIRWATAEALIALGDEGLKQTLVALLTKASSGDLRRAARHVIWHFGHFPRGEFLRPLLARFNAFVPGVAIPPAALKALRWLKSGDELASGTLSGESVVRSEESTCG
jgi:HEAT repeat protein